MTTDPETVTDTTDKSHFPRLPGTHRRSLLSFIATGSFNLHPFPMNCRQAEQALSRHIDGELSTGQTARLEKHIVNCAACRATASNWQGYGDKLRTDQPTGMPDPTRAWHDIRRAIRTRENPAAETRGRSWWARPLPWAGAAATLVLLAIGYVVRFSPGAGSAGGEAVEYVDTDLPGASTIVYVDDESGWNIVWVVESAFEPDPRI